MLVCAAQLLEVTSLRHHPRCPWVLHDIRLHGSASISRIFFPRPFLLCLNSLYSEAQCMISPLTGGLFINWRSQYVPFLHSPGVIKICSQVVLVAGSKRQAHAWEFKSSISNIHPHPQLSTVCQCSRSKLFLLYLSESVRGWSVILPLTMETWPCLYVLRLFVVLQTSRCSVLTDHLFC